MTEEQTRRPVDLRAGDLRIRLAETSKEVRTSQALRYRVFCEEMAAKPSAEMALAEREFDSFDEHCEHLLVFDHGRGAGAVVGTYRLMRREAAGRRGQFYTSGEYDITKLIRSPGAILELGRSCVDYRYRTGSTMQMLWRGIADYVLHYDIELMFGCASLPGTDPEDLASSLSYLHHYHLAPPSLRVRALPERYVAMNRLAPEDFDRNLARKEMPPLIKGYLRLGGMVGDGAVIDHDFGTTDVCLIVQTDRVTERYYRHYAREEPAKSREGI